MATLILIYLVLMILCGTVCSYKDGLENPSRKYCELCADWKNCEGTDVTCPWRSGDVKMDLEVE